MEFLISLLAQLFEAFFQGFFNGPSSIAHWAGLGILIVLIALVISAFV